MSAADPLYAACSFSLPVAGTGVLRITGELDACSAELIEQTVEQTLAPEVARLVLDLSELDFIDSSGIRLLIRMIAPRQSRSEVVVLCPEATPARRALELVGFCRIIRTVASLDEALTMPRVPGREMQVAAP